MALTTEKLVAVIGGGAAGMVCASRLVEKGCKVTVFESGRGPGGRMSHRREKTPDGKELYFDHGAQYFTVKDPAVQQLVERWEASGILAEWKGNFGSYDLNAKKFIQDFDVSKKRYVGVPGMNAICKAMSQQYGVESRYGITITDIKWEEKEKRWLLSGKDRQFLGRYEAVVASDKNLASSRFYALNGVSPPLAEVGFPQCENIAAVTASPCFATMVAFPRPVTSVPFDGVSVIGSEVLSWVSRDSSKPGRRAILPEQCECWVLQSTSKFAKEIIEKEGLRKPSEELLSFVADSMLKHFGVLFDIPAPFFIKAHRWGSAFPDIALAPDAKCLPFGQKKIVVCGDFCLGPRVESAILSGLSAAENVDLFLQN